MTALPDPTAVRANWIPIEIAAAVVADLPLVVVPVDVPNRYTGKVVRYWEITTTTTDDLVRYDVAHRSPVRGLHRSKKAATAAIDGLRDFVVGTAISLPINDLLHEAGGEFGPVYAEMVRRHVDAIAAL